MLLPRKRSDHAHAVQIFLQHGAEAAIRFVRRLERLLRLHKKEKRKPENDRNHRHADERHGHVERPHQRQHDGDQKECVADFDELHGEKLPDRLHIGRAALNQIAGFGVDMIIVSQMLQMVIDAVADALRRRFRRKRRPLAFQI